MSEAVNQLKYRIGGMDCAGCAAKIETAVARLPGVSQVGVSLASGVMTLTRSPNSASGAIERQVQALGYSIAPRASPSPGLPQRGCIRSSTLTLPSSPPAAARWSARAWTGPSANRTSVAW